GREPRGHRDHPQHAREDGGDAAPDASLHGLRAPGVGAKFGFGAAEIPAERTGQASGTEDLPHAEIALQLLALVFRNFRWHRCLESSPAWICTLPLFPPSRLL